MAASLPCRGLRLRRPGRSIHAALVEGTGGRWRLDCRAEPGRSAHAPVWIESSHWRPFSVEWLQARNSAGHPLLRVFAHDAELPLELAVGAESRGLRPHAQREWADWELAEQDNGAPFTLRLHGIPLIDGRLSKWVSPPAPAAIARKPAARVVSLREPARPFTLPAEACRAWYRGPAVAAAEPVGLDPWGVPEADLQAALEKHVFDDTAVLILLENDAFARGLSGPQVRRRLTLVLHGIARSGGLPVLVLPADLDVKSPLKRHYALAFVRLSNEFGCPLVDLRKMGRDG